MVFLNPVLHTCAPQSPDLHGSSTNTFSAPGMKCAREVNNMRSAPVNFPNALSDIKSFSASKGGLAKNSFSGVNDAAASALSCTLDKIWSEHWVSVCPLLCVHPNQWYGFGSPLLHQGCFCPSNLVAEALPRNQRSFVSHVVTVRARNHSDSIPRARKIEIRIM